jgi:phosphatidylserine/phosphatidylglycerophosphate/cardiolipin synthase-like enzyme
MILRQENTAAPLIPVVVVAAERARPVCIWESPRAGGLIAFLTVLFYSATTDFCGEVCVDEAAVIGGILFQAPDPLTAADTLERYFVSAKCDENELRASGVEPRLAEAIRHRLPTEPAAIHLACARGAAWVLGYRASLQTDRWELVASIPAGMPLPPGVRRATAETLIALVAEAQESIRILAPYIDPSGLELLSDAITAATTRGVVAEVFVPGNWQPGIDAVRRLRRLVDQTGNIKLLHISEIAVDAPIAHMKVVVADGRAAYVGSANITGAGLRSRNAELGVLLHGPGVAAVNAVLDSYRGS